MVFRLNELNYKITTWRHGIKYQFDLLTRSGLPDQNYFKLIRESLRLLY